MRCSLHVPVVKRIRLGDLANNLSIPSESLFPIHHEILASGAYCYVDWEYVGRTSSIGVLLSTLPAIHWESGSATLFSKGISNLCTFTLSSAFPFDCFLLLKVVLKRNLA
jgi:hypothetical protein